MPRSPAPHTVKCPTCGIMVVWSKEQRWRPFCSERCRLIDLGSWFDESNRIPGQGDTLPSTTEPED